MLKRVGVAIVFVLLAGAALCGQDCTTQSYLVTRGTAEAAQSAIVRTIDGAVRALDVAVASLADVVIADAIVRASQRGAAVRVLLAATARTEPAGQYAKLVAAKVSVKLVATTASLPDRCAVIDAATAIVGTYEWAGGIDQPSYGTLTVIQCGSAATGRSRAQEYAADFARLWNAVPDPQASPAPRAATAPAQLSMLIAIQEIDTDGQCVLLFNRGTTAADLSGWVLTDSEGRYVFPEGFTLGAGELYHFCLGALNPADIFLFFLDPEHDELYLVAPDGTLVDQVVW